MTVKKFETYNPATGQKIAEYDLMSDRELQERLQKSMTAWNRWRNIDVESRSQLFLELAKILEQEKDSLAQLIVLEMGKVYAQARAEVEKCGTGARYYAENGPRLLKDFSLPTSGQKAYISYQPLGPILGIMPWNFPLWQVLRFAVPTMVAGNTVLLKHAPSVTGLALRIPELFRKAGFPEDVFQTLVIDIPQVEQVMAFPGLGGVSLTGSTRAGRSVASLAGKYLKKCVLELGGNDPYVILDDADLDLAAEKCITSRLLNSGQSCIAAKRWIVTKKNRAEFESKIRRRLESKKWGDPMDTKTDLGPLARQDLRDTLHSQVELSRKSGAQVVLGGEVPEHPGYFYPPTLLTEVKPGQVAFEEELFGPVVSLIEAKDEDEAIVLANQTQYGLGAGIFSRNVERAEKIAREQLQAGNCFVNDYVRSDPRWPFGGIKDSGFGRELSAVGLHEFVNIKTVSV